MPWYREGLRFTCTRCGNCCTGEPGYVWVNEDELATLADYLEQPVQEVTARYVRSVRGQLSLRERPNGECVFWDRAAGCTVYSARPTQCRTWPFWESNIKNEEAWRQTCAVCPGSGQGPIIPVEQILQQASIVRL